MNQNNQDEAFRDSISTVDKAGKRVWIYPKKPSGKLHTARAIVSFFLILILIVTPFIEVNGHPFVLLNVLQRRFIIFGLSFGPHDFYLFVLAFISLIVFVVLFTAIYGRIFCGWICPQTVFMEMVFRKVEYLIEGDANEQKKLQSASWSASKLFKKSIKHGIFYAVSYTHLTLPTIYSV